VASTFENRADHPGVIQAAANFFQQPCSDLFNYLSSHGRRRV
jgi:hypothetical protein